MFNSVNIRNPRKFASMVLHYHHINLVFEDLHNFNRDEIKNPNKLWMHIADWKRSAEYHEYVRKGDVPRTDWEIEIWAANTDRPYLHFVLNQDFDRTHPIGSKNPVWLEIARSGVSADDQRAAIAKWKKDHPYYWKNNTYL